MTGIVEDSQQRKNSNVDDFTEVGGSRAQTARVARTPRPAASGATPSGSGGGGFSFAQADIRRKKNERNPLEYLRKLGRRPGGQAD